MLRAPITINKIPQNRPESRNDNAAGERVVRGEVISSRVTQQRNVNSTQGALDGRGASSQQSDARQISIRAAVQNYRDNEALIAPQGENRQVSGIIDEYV